ncbi:MAG: AI-2E family transporter [Methylocystaceae bacterium]
MYRKPHWRLWLLIMVALATIYFLYRVHEIMTPFVIGSLLAYLLYRPVRWLEAKGLPRTVAILLFYLGLAALGYCFLFLLLPHFWREISELANYLPTYYNNLLKYWQDHGGNTLSVIDFTPIKTHLQHMANNWLKNMTTGLINSFSVIIDLIFSPLLGYYIMRDWDKLRQGFLSLWPVRMRKDIIYVGTEIDLVLQEFVRGELTVCLIEGFLVGVVTVLLGIKFALLIGILAAVAELFPYFGPLLSGIPAVGMALLQSPRLAVYTLIAFIIIQQIEGNIISPRIIGDRVGLNPLLVIFALLAGGVLFGLWGMLLAVPVTAVIKVVGRFTYQRLV